MESGTSTTKDAPIAQLQPCEEVSTSQKPSMEDPTDQPTEEKVHENEEYITGTKLLAVTGSVTLVAFLLMMDQSILGTVSLKSFMVSHVGND